MSPTEACVTVVGVKYSGGSKAEGGMRLSDSDDVPHIQK